MKRYLFFIILLINTLILYSQPPSVHLVLQSGVSVPLFDFAAPNLQKGSFALTGFTGSAEAKVSLNDKWGAFIQGGIQFNPVEVGLLGYAKVQADPFLEDLYIRSDPFKVIHIMAGPSYTTRLSKYFLLEGQLAAGVFMSSTPYQLYKPEYFFQGLPFYEITPSHDLSLAYGAGIRIIYEVTPCYQIGVSTQYMQSQASFDFMSAGSIRTDIRNINLWNNSFSLIIKLFEGQVKTAIKDI